MSETVNDEKRETIAEVVATMRRGTKLRGFWSSCDLNEILAYHADRIEAAWKRERDELIYAYDPTKAAKGRIPDGSAYALEAMREPVGNPDKLGNASAMYKALVNVRTYLLKSPYAVDEDGVMADVVDALARPRRNCDVGTPDEQANRFHDFCAGNSSGINGMCKPTCPCIDCFDKCQCFAKWAQTPYSEKGAVK